MTKQLRGFRIADHTPGFLASGLQRAAQGYNYGHA